MTHKWTAETFGVSDFRGEENPWFTQSPPTMYLLTSRFWKCFRNATRFKWNSKSCDRPLFATRHKPSEPIYIINWNSMLKHWKITPVSTPTKKCLDHTVDVAIIIALRKGQRIFGSYSICKRAITFFEEIRNILNYAHTFKNNCNIKSHKRDKHCGLFALFNVIHFIHIHWVNQD